MDITKLGLMAFATVFTIFGLRGLLRLLPGFWQKRKMTFAARTSLSPQEIEGLFSVTRDPLYRFLRLAGSLCIVATGMSLLAIQLVNPSTMLTEVAFVALVVCVPAIFILAGLLFMTKTRTMFRIGQLNYPEVFIPNASLSGLSSRYVSPEAFGVIRTRIGGAVMCAIGIMMLFVIGSVAWQGFTAVTPPDHNTLTSGVK